ncbi:hypothetical protein BG015_002896 [Linnemannia schmuckeri]|uniref:Beta-lactamase-related domain-containing protein n=1 Tax=Linnemannia schmuckeri TaxID=64567 RepID=A0A9P5VDC6_9FUNG|nr:hypothetical protein BG015_002896 [Linnemannia schmuckeri]
MTDSKGATPAPAPARWRKYAFLNLTPAQYFVRLIPAIVYGFYMYSSRGPFQPASCTGFGLHCPMATNHITGVLERPEYYGQVLGYYTNLIAQAEDLGGSLAVFVDGQAAVEGIIIARLVDQGKLDYEAKIVEYWPEFGQNGKENVRLRDLMVHESGVPALDDEDKLDVLSWASQGDEEKFSERLARQPHAFGGKPTRAYHGITRGWFLNEIVKRVDHKGRTIGQIAQQDLMTDYEDLELYYAKLPKESDWEDRLSPMHDYPLLRLFGRLVLPQAVLNSKVFGYPHLLPLHRIVKKSFESKSLTAKALMPKFAPWPHLFRTPEAHVYEGTSFSLKTNAHSLARLMSMMANKGGATRPGEPDLISPAVYTQATTLHGTAVCEVTGETFPLSVGGWVKTRDFYGEGPLKGVEVQGWAGAGGSMIMWIEELGIGFSYVTNAFAAPETLLGDFRGKTLLDRVVYARKGELGLLPKKKATTPEGGADVGAGAEAQAAAEEKK